MHAEQSTSDAKDQRWRARKTSLALYTHYLVELHCSYMCRHTVGYTHHGKFCWTITLQMLKLDVQRADNYNYESSDC